MLSFSPIVDSVRDSLNANVRHFSKLVGWATIVVAVGVALEGIELCHDAVSWAKRKRREERERSELRELALIFPASDIRGEKELHSDHPKWAKRLLRAGLILVVIGVVGEWRCGEKLEDAHKDLHEYDVGKLTAADEKAGDAAKSAKTARDEADAATAAATEVQEKVTEVDRRAGEIDSDLSRTQYLLSARSVTDPVSLIKGLKQYKGLAVYFGSYNSEPDESLLCGELISAARSAEMNVLEDTCGRVVQVGLPSTGIVVSGPDIPQTMAIAQLLLHTSNLGAGGVVSAIKAAELHIFVGAKPPFMIGQARGVPAAKINRQNKAKPKP